jgi:Zn-dependent M28 family amino/carboxypeptidase
MPGQPPNHCDLERLRGHVLRLADEIGERNVYHPQALHAAERYITDVWTNQGYEVIPQKYSVRGVRSANLEVTRRGHVYPDEILLIGAHYDSVIGSPGANDNASGVGALLELSRLFRKRKPARTIRFVAFVNEEPPFFFTKEQGSLLYARSVRKRGDDIRLMIALETIGYYRDEPGSQRYPPLFRFFYPDTANFISLVSNFRSRGRMRKLAWAFRQVSDFPLAHVATFSLIPGVAWSDHLSFWREHYRALMVTDTAFYRYPYYHSARDTADRLDYERLCEVTTGLAEAVGLLSDQGV